MNEHCEPTLVFATSAELGARVANRAIAGGAIDAAVIVLTSDSLPPDAPIIRLRRLDDYGDSDEAHKWASGAVREAARRIDERSDESFRRFPAWRDTFFHFFLWTALVRLRRIEAALDAEEPAQVVVAESLADISWWACGLQLAELVRAACARRGLPCRAFPAAPWRRCARP